ncbi:MAG: Ada metal-binding domain-containing protein, partial [Undibacterium sp.]|nr:Ada metal-binding domain-containing protein [Undibacterium sp.]
MTKDNFSTTTVVEREQAYYRAVVAKDTRFDGVFFTGIKTTGIYCRPVCSAKTP